MALLGSSRREALGYVGGHHGGESARPAALARRLRCEVLHQQAAGDRASLITVLSRSELMKVSESHHLQRRHNACLPPIDHGLYTRECHQAHQPPAKNTDCNLVAAVVTLTVGL